MSGPAGEETASSSSTGGPQFVLPKLSDGVKAKEIPWIISKGLVVPDGTVVRQGIVNAWSPPPTNDVSTNLFKMLFGMKQRKKTAPADEEEEATPAQTKQASDDEDSDSEEEWSDDDEEDDVSEKEDSDSD